MVEGLFTPLHLVLILVILLFLFGAKKLPDLGKSLGSGMRGFREGLSELHTDVTDEQPAPAAAEPRVLSAQAPTDAAAGDVPPSSDRAEQAGS